MIKKKLDGQIAVVTGGSSGIGLASAKLFAAEGAHVFVTGRRKLQGLCGVESGRAFVRSQLDCRLEGPGNPRQHHQSGTDRNAGTRRPGGFTAKEIAESVFYLAPDQSSYVSGIELAVDGGQAQV